MKQCKECPLNEICRGCVDNDTWWNISEDCPICDFVKQREQTIFELENRLKECENGYEGTLFLESCKLKDAEDKIKELTEQVELWVAISKNYQRELDELKKKYAGKE